MKKIILALIIVFALSSCGSTKDAMNLGSNLKKVEVGMTKKEVISVLGKSYSPKGGVQTPNGVVDIISYEDINGQKYSFHFLEGELVEWYKEDAFRQHPPRPHNRAN